MIHDNEISRTLLDTINMMDFKIYCPYCFQVDTALLGRKGYYRFECDVCKHRFVFVTNWGRAKSFKTSEFDLSLNILTQEDIVLLQMDIAHNNNLGTKPIIKVKKEERIVEYPVNTETTVRVNGNIRINPKKIIGLTLKKSTFKEMILSILECKNCGAPLNPTTGDKYIKCQACGYYTYIRVG